MRRRVFVASALASAFQDAGRVMAFPLPLPHFTWSEGMNRALEHIQSRHGLVKKGLNVKVGRPAPPSGKRIAQNIGQVPFWIGGPVLARQAEAVSRIAFFQAAHERPLVARFHFTPLCGRAEIAGRVRLDGRDLCAATGDHDFVAVAFLRGEPCHMGVGTVRVFVACDFME